MKVTLGGDRLGSGSKEKIDINEYGRSTHNLSYLFRTTGAAGTVIPFACEVMLPGDDYDIDMDIEVLTHPTTGPVFGSMKVAADIFTGDIRLYQGKLHNNLTGTGLQMSNIKLPIFELWSDYMSEAERTATENPDNISINPSCVLAYLGTRGVGIQDAEETQVKRDFNAVPWLLYWDIMKNYYCNQQEEEGAVIHTPGATLIEDVDTIEINGSSLTQFPTTTLITLSGAVAIEINTLTDTQPLNQVIIATNLGNIPASEIGTLISHTGGSWILEYDIARWGLRTAINWFYIDIRQMPAGPIQVQRFPLSEIDAMREGILAWAANPAPYNVNDSAGAPDTALQPWSFILDGETQATDTFKPKLSSQEGLGLKTYLSDLFNNWLNTDWIDGPGGINELTAIDTTGGSIEIDTINFAEKLYETLNRIVIAGNTYDDYMDAGYTSKRWTRPEIPVYHGGLIKELVFQEVISNSESGSENQGVQPLGTLGGRGKLGSKHKGGSVTVKANELSYLMGMFHITPKIDYSQGNRWDVHLKTVADFRLPGLDEIGFQELITEQQAWWDSYHDETLGTWVQKSAGKQPAWQNYRTNVNRVFGNFAIAENEMFMTLNRRYRAVADSTGYNIDDLTTYIDPAKYNWIFAQTSLDSQNFWIQIAVSITGRRIMSTRVIPNL